MNKYLDHSLYLLLLVGVLIWTTEVLKLYYIRLASFILT